MQFKFVPLAISAWITPSPAGNLRSLPYHSYDFWIALTKNELNHNKLTTPNSLTSSWTLIKDFLLNEIFGFWIKTISHLPPPTPDISYLPFLLFLLRTYHYPIFISLCVCINHSEDAWENVFLLSLSSAWHLIDPQILVEQMNNLDTSQDQRKSRYSEKQEQSLKFLILHFCPSCTL